MKIERLFNSLTVIMVDIDISIQEQFEVKFVEMSTMITILCKMMRNFQLPHLTFFMSKSEIKWKEKHLC